eukprot:6186742-Karenia_brevis.AAC.1
MSVQELFVRTILGGYEVFICSLACLPFASLQVTQSVFNTFLVPGESYHVRVDPISVRRSFRKTNVDVEETKRFQDI